VFRVYNKFSSPSFVLVWFCCSETCNGTFFSFGFATTKKATTCCHLLVFGFFCDEEGDTNKLSSPSSVLVLLQRKSKRRKRQQLPSPSLMALVQKMAMIPSPF
jgi:hypothetical protein